jgi:HEAT repeat protein
MKEIIAVVKRKKFYALLIITVAVCSVFLVSVFAQAKKKNFITYEEAYAICYKHELEALEKKYRDLGLGHAIGSKEWPKPTEPFYVFYFEATKCVNSSAHHCVQTPIDTQLFYIDAYTGEVVSQKEAQRRIRKIRIDTAKEHFIQVDQLIWDLPETKFLRNKYKGEEYNFHICEIESPTSENPFYAISYRITKEDIDAPDKVTNILSTTFYVDAHTGEVDFDQELRKKLLAEMESEKALLENEKSLQAEIKKAQVAIQENIWKHNKEEHISLIKGYIPLFLKALNAFMPDIRSEGARILGNLARDGIFPYKAKEAVPRLVELLKDKDYGVRYSAVEALANLGEKGDEGLVKAILPLISDKDSLVRRTAIESLGKLGDKLLVPVFIPLLEDSAVNQAIVPALGNFGDVSSVEPLIKLFYNKDFFYLERAIISALGKIGGNQAIGFLVGLFDKTYTKDNKFRGSFEPLYPYMGVDAAKALANIGESSKPYLIESLKSKDYLARLYAVYALSLLQDATTIEILNQALSTEKDPTIKTYLEIAIAQIQDKEFISPLLAQVKIWVEPSKKKYRLNEAIKVYLYLQNKGAAPFIINTVPLEYADLSLEIFGPEGNPVICPIEFCRTTFPTKDSLITLSPQQVRKFGSYRLQDYYYQFERKGKYEIKGNYSNSLYGCGIEFGVYALTGTVESEKTIIEIE